MATTHEDGWAVLKDPADFNPIFDLVELWETREAAIQNARGFLSTTKDLESFWVGHVHHGNPVVRGNTAFVPTFIDKLERVQ